MEGVGKGPLPARDRRKIWALRHCDSQTPFHDAFSLVAHWLPAGLHGDDLRGTLRPFDFRWDAREISQYFPTPEWIPFTLWDDRVGLWGYLEDKLVNVIMFMPFGAALALLIPTCRRRSLLALITLSALLCSLSIETLQYFIPERHSMASDILMNTIGGFLGAWLTVRWRGMGKNERAES